MESTEANYTFDTNPLSDTYKLPEKGIEKNNSPYFNMQHDYIVTDPYNMRAVDELLFSITLQKRFSMHEKGRLFIIMGEDHRLPSNFFARMGLIESFAMVAKKQPKKQFLKPIYAFECPPNALAYSILRYLKKPLPKIEDFIKITSKLNDQESKLLTNIFIANYQNGERHCMGSTHSRYYENLTILRSNMPVIPVDADIAGNYTSRLDPLAAIVANEKGLNAETITIKEKPYLACIIRNEVMARRIISASSENEAGVIIIGTGKSHVSMSSKRYNHNYHNETLSKALANKINENDHIIAFYPVDEIGDRDYDIGLAPDMLNEKQITTIRLNGLSLDTFPTCYDNKENQELIDTKELEFIKKLADSYNRVAVPKRFTNDNAPSPEETKKLITPIANTIATL